MIDKVPTLWIIMKDEDENIQVEIIVSTHNYSMFTGKF